MHALTDGSSAQSLRAACAVRRIALCDCPAEEIDVEEAEQAEEVYSEEDDDEIVGEEEEESSDTEAL